MTSTNKSDAPQSAAQQVEREDKYRGLALAGLMFTLIVAVLSYQLNASMVTPALPAIGRDFVIDESTVSLVSSLFFLAGAVAGIILTRWSDFVGRKRMLIYVLVILFIGTLVCVFAPSFPIFMVGRVIQGVSGAVFQLTYMILSESVSAKTFGTMMGIITAVNGGVGGLDGWFGGLLTNAFGFRSIFIVIAVLVLIAIILTGRGISQHANDAATGKMDWWGGATLSLGLIFLTYYVNYGGSDGWFAPISLGFLAGTVICFIGFYFVERKVDSPLFAIEHLASRHCWPLIATTLLSLSSVFAVINFTVAMFSQNPEVGFGLDAGKAALLFLTPPAMIGLAAAPLSGWLASKIGWLQVLRGGLIISILSIGGIWLCLDNQWAVFAFIAVLGISYNGMILTTINGLGVLLAPPEAPGSLPGLNGAAFGVGASLGIGLVTPFIGTFAGYRTALIVSLGIAVLALVTACILKPREGQKI